MAEISKSYEPRDVEKKWYAAWLEARAFAGVPAADKKPYSIVIPPPNVTGVLTMGHVLNNTLQDILVRRARQEGKSALWIPGTDHAGIATQTVVERELRKQKKTRHDFGREKFIEKVWAWRQEKGGIILEQLRRLGASCDWDRTHFTMDPAYSRAVLTVFVDLFRKGHIYRGKRMVNWCPASQTALSDEEVIMKPVNGTLYHVRYELADQPGKFIEVKTTRPETIPGDVAIAVHPDDPRYAGLIGKTVWRPLNRAKIPIIADTAVDKEFGSGALKITPAHDKVDFEVGLRHQLPILDVLNADGTLNELAGPGLTGLDRFAGRKKAAELLKESGALVGEEAYANNVGYSERADVPIEPRLTWQWWLRYPRVEEAKAAVRDSHIKFYPERWSKVYLHWLENIQDWCISRQLWWGHRIPVWYRQGLDKEKLTEADLRDPKKIHISLDGPADKGNWVQEDDVLDTWFSSWLWPFATMGWPDAGEMKKAGLDYFYPTATLVTGPDIIFFWVARMIMAGLEFIGDSPMNSKPQARGEGQEARGEGQEARGEGQEARGEGQEARGEGQEARGEGQEARGEGQEARGEGQEARGEGQEARGEGQEARGEGQEARGEGQEARGEGQEARGEGQEARGEGQEARGEGQEARGEGQEARGEGQEARGEGQEARGEGQEARGEGQEARGEGQEARGEGQEARGEGQEARGEGQEARGEGQEARGEGQEARGEGQEARGEGQEARGRVSAQSTSGLAPLASRLSEKEIAERVPFRNVYFTGIIRDAQGRKMSKSLGNSPDPLDLIDKYGADGLRFGIVSIAPQGQDIRFQEDRIEFGKNFCNKLWNACRFRQMSGESGDNATLEAIVTCLDPAKFDADDHAILDRLLTITRDVDRCFREFEFSAAVQALYGFFWNDFCDWYVEVSKTKLQSAETKVNCLAIQDVVLRQTLLLLHPFIPFITEELWQLLGYGAANTFLMRDARIDDSSQLATALADRGVKLDDAQVGSVEAVKAFVSQARALKADHNLASRRDVRFFAISPHAAWATIQANMAKLTRMAGAAEIIRKDKVDGAPAAVTPLGTLYLDLAGTVDVAAEKQRLTKEIEALAKHIAGTEARLSNQAFVSKAPPAVLDGAKKQLAELQAKKTEMERLRAALG